MPVTSKMEMTPLFGFWYLAVKDPLPVLISMSPDKPLLMITVPRGAPGGYQSLDMNLNDVRAPLSSLPSVIVMGNVVKLSGFCGKTSRNLRNFLPQNRDPHVGIEEISHSTCTGGGKSG